MRSAPRSFADREVATNDPVPSEPEQAPSMQRIEVGGASIEYAWYLPGSGADDRCQWHRSFTYTTDLAALLTGNHFLTSSHRRPAFQLWSILSVGAELHRRCSAPATRTICMRKHASSCRGCSTLLACGSAISTATATAARSHSCSPRLFQAERCPRWWKRPTSSLKGITLKSVATMASRFERDPDFRERLSKYHRDPNGAFRSWAEAWLLPSFRSWTIVDDFDKLQFPLLVIQGPADPFGTMEHARLIQKRAGRTVLILELPASGHNPHIGAESVTLGAVARFLRRMENGPSDNGRQKRKDSANLANF